MHLYVFLSLSYFIWILFNMGFKCLYPLVALKCAHVCVQRSEQSDNNLVPFFMRRGKLGDAGWSSWVLRMGHSIIILVMLMLHWVRACQQPSRWSEMVRSLKEGCPACQRCQPPSRLCNTWVTSCCSKACPIFKVCKDSLFEVQLQDSFEHEV
jgi:hypothetical protein